MSSHRAGKPFVVRQRREDGETLHHTPKHRLCHACWRIIPTGDYCTPEHAAAHQRLTR